MLPSTGLFKTIVCPYYHSAGSSNSSGTTCHRPYCHFKHVKKDDPEKKTLQISTPVPEYTPAPRLQKLSCDPVSSLVAQKKKRNIEYRPDKPELQYTKSSRQKDSSVNSADVAAPIYVPSSTSALVALNLDDCNEELDELTEIYDEQISGECTDTNLTGGNDVANDEIETKFSPTEEIEDLDEIIDSKISPIEKVEQLKKEVEEKPVEKLNEIKQEEDDRKSSSSKEVKLESQTVKVKKEEEDKKKTSSGSSNSNKDRHREERRNSTSSISSSRHKHKSSSSSKERSREKDRKTSTDSKRDRDKQDDSGVQNKEKDKCVNAKASSSSSKSRNSTHSKQTSSSSTTSDSNYKKHGGHSSSSSSKKHACSSSSSPLSKNEENASVSAKSNEHKSKEHRLTESKLKDSHAKEDKLKEHESKEPKSREAKLREPKSREPKSRETKSSETKSRETKSRENKSQAHKSRDNKPEEHKTEEHKSKEHKTKEYKSKCSHSSASSKESAILNNNANANDEPIELFATSEADIMKECEMIYDQLEQQFATQHENDPAGFEADKSQTVVPKRKASIEEAESSAVVLPRKRIAYENADKFKLDTPSVIRKPNHLHNAMQAVYNRQAILHKKQEEEATAAEIALREAEEKVREANEALQKVKAKTLTPLIPKSYLTPPTRVNSRSIAPVANMLALERAKKRIEELKAEKTPAFTPAQTAKRHERIAHKATVASTSVEPEKQPKPPVLEATSTKISFNLRMQYYDMMVKHCLLIYPNVTDAWERAQTEELAVFRKCNTPVIYKSSAMLAINKLRKEATDSGNRPDGIKHLVSHEVILAGKLARNTSWSVQKEVKTNSTFAGEHFDKLPGDKAYNMVYELRLTEEQLVKNGFPRAGKRLGTATIFCSKPMRCPGEGERYCSRCGKAFHMSMYDEVCVDECNYHPKGTGYRRGFADNQHHCCQQPAGSPGCMYANYHVSDFFDADNLTGYVATIDKGDDYVPTKKDIYAVDCEMCYTTHGIELTRVTVVDVNARTVYDALVKPDNKIVDYNTIYSGITEELLKNETRTLRDVQAILMSMFHSKTVLIGHSLESDLKALKLIHNVVVDTSVLFPHKMGPPKKRALKTLCIENLKRIIQESVSGHDSAEDAEVCIQLVKFYLRHKIS